MLTAQQLAAPAFAQDVPADEADDAFGRRVGVESIGLYGESQVRGFNLENAGNYRLEGHYFAKAASPQYVIRDATITRIGVNALRYDFPAPSGVVEFDLLRAEPGETLRVEAGTLDHSGPFADIVGSVGRESYQLIAGVNLSPNQRYMNGAGGDYYGGGVVARWAPARDVDLAAFATASDWVADPDIGFQPDGEFIPRRIKRGTFRGQEWAKYNNRQVTAGMFGSAGLGDGWKLGAGAFHSSSKSDRNDFHLLDLENEGGDYRSYAFVSAGRQSAAQSGSMTLERSWSGGSLRHRLVGTLRYRETETKTAPYLTFDLGEGSLSETYEQIARPDFDLPKSKALDRVRQKTAGIGYRLGVGNSIELRADVQKTDYTKTSTSITDEQRGSESSPWLFSGSALWGVSPDLTLFGSYSRGLEESGVAPNSASNRGEVLPAVIATQRELGLRYTVSPGLSLIAGLFDTRKDMPGAGPDGRFGLIGEVRHRGVEASLAGTVTPRINVVAGMMLLDATVSGELVEEGLVGSKAVGRPSRVGLLNLNWRTKLLEGLSLDATVNHEGPRYVSAANSLKSDPLTTVDLGMRYAFRAGKQPLSVRARVVNLFDQFRWVPDVSGTLYPNAQRAYRLSLSATL